MKKCTYKKGALNNPSLRYYVCTKPSNFSVLSKFYQYLSSELSINTGTSVYLEAMLEQ